MMQITKETSYVVLMALVYGLAVLPLSFELPAISAIGTAFKLSHAEMKLSITTFWAFFTLGQFLFAYMLPKYPVQKIISFAIVIFILSFTIHAFTHSSHIFFILRILEGLCCGGFLLMGRFAMAKAYGANESNYLIQFAKLSSAITALTVLLPILGGVINDYSHWRYIYLVIASMGLGLYFLRRQTFIFIQPRSSSPKKDFMVVLGNMELMCKSLLGGFARSIIVNFNTNLALFLLNYHHWSSMHYASLMFVFSCFSIVARLYLRQLREVFGAIYLNYILMLILLIAPIFFLFNRLYAYDLLFYLAGGLITVASSLLATLYSSTTQFKLANQKQAMSLAVMGVIQNIALVAGTVMSIFLANDTLFSLSELIVLSTCVLFVIDYASNGHHRQFESFASN